LGGSKHNLLWNWLGVALWLVIIALESTDLFSSAHTGSFLYSLVTGVFGAMDPRAFEALHAVLRKSGHFVGYAVLSLLVFRALAATFRRAAAFVEIRWALASIAFTFLVAGLDEWHQALLPSRTGTFRDVALDTAGAIVVQALVLAAVRRHGAKHAVIESVGD
jgi:VanZ family protein